VAPIRKRKRRKDVSAGIHPATTPINNTTTTTTTIITAAADMLRTGQMNRIASGISGAYSYTKERKQRRKCWGKPYWFSYT